MADLMNFVSCQLNIKRVYINSELLLDTNIKNFGKHDIKIELKSF